MPAPLPLGEKPCERCGVIIRRQRSNGGGTPRFERQRFCSQACRNRAITVSGKPKRERPISMAQLAVLAIFRAIQDEDGIPVARKVSRRYWQLRGMTEPIRYDGQPDTATVVAIMVNLQKRGLLQRRPGIHQGTRTGAYRITPLGRETLASNSGVLVVVADEPAAVRRFIQKGKR